MHVSAQVLVLFAHPALEKSRVNRHLVDAARGLAGVTVHDLYEVYPEMHIDVQHEQALLEAHNTVVFQYPFYWYNTPAILKEWQDLVLEHGWAYGGGGRALRGKRLLCAITTGGAESAYQRDGHNHFTMAELLTPLEQTARLCGMEFVPPFVVHGTHALTNEDIAVHARSYRQTLTALSEDRLDFAQARTVERLNSDLEALIRT